MASPWLAPATRLILGTTKGPERRAPGLLPARLGPEMTKGSKRCAPSPGDLAAYLLNAGRPHTILV